MRSVGLSIDTGGGKRSNSVRLRDQMNRFFSASIGLQSVSNSGSDDAAGMRVTRQTHFWNPKDPNRQDGWLELSQDFYQMIINSPVPVDTRALKALNHSPLALDLYAWSTHKAYSTSLKNKSVYFSYRDLQQQLGSQYSEPPHDCRRRSFAMSLR